MKAISAAAVAMVIGGVLLLSSGGDDVSPRPQPAGDSLAQSHANDRATQVRILREYVTQTFASDQAAQQWLNEQRVSARPTDWTPYTDELGKACLDGQDAVKALADRLELQR